MTAGDEIIDRMTRAALALASERGWRTMSLAEIAARAEVPLLDAYRAVPTKTALLALLIDASDRAVLSGGAATMTDTARDRLFDVVMRRFDSLQSRREGTVAILRDLPCDPPALLCLLPRFARSMAWMLEAAGISSVGLAGSLRRRGPRPGVPECAARLARGRQPRHGANDGGGRQGSASSRAAGAQLALRRPA